MRKPECKSIKVANNGKTSAHSKSNYKKFNPKKVALYIYIKLRLYSHLLWFEM